MGLARQILRRQRIANGEAHPKVLDAINDNIQNNSYLHATKGYRHISVKRTKAALLTAELKKGQVPFNTELMRSVMRAPH